MLKMIYAITNYKYRKIAILYYVQVACAILERSRQIRPAIFVSKAKTKGILPYGPEFFKITRGQFFCKNRVVPGRNSQRSGLLSDVSRQNL